MDKSTIISNINGFITAVITQLKHRNSMLELVNNLWSTVYNDTKIGTSLTPLSATTPLVTTIDYDLVLNRTGNKVAFVGWLYNSGSPAVGGTDICTIDIADLEAKSILSSFIATAPYTGQTCLITFTDKLTISSSLAVGQYFYFSGTYFTND